MIVSMTTQKRSYRRETKYGRQLRVTVEPATAAALEAESDAAGLNCLGGDPRFPGARVAAGQGRPTEKTEPRPERGRSG